MHAVLLSDGTPSTLQRGKCPRCCSQMAHQAHFTGQNTRGAAPRWHTKRTSTGKCSRCCSQMAHQAHFDGESARGAALKWHTKRTSPGKTHAVLLTDGTPSTLRRGKCPRCCSQMAHQAHFDGTRRSGHKKSLPEGRLPVTTLGFKPKTS